MSLGCSWHCWTWPTCRPVKGLLWRRWRVTLQTVYAGDLHAGALRALAELCGAGVGRRGSWPASQPAEGKSIARRVEQGNGRLITELLTSCAATFTLPISLSSLSLSTPFLPLETQKFVSMFTFVPRDNAAVSSSRLDEHCSFPLAARIPPPVVKIRFLNNERGLVVLLGKSGKGKLLSLLYYRMEYLVGGS